MRRDCRLKTTLLYERGRREREGAPLLGFFVRRFLGWAKGGLGAHAPKMSATLDAPMLVEADRAGARVPRS